MARRGWRPYRHGVTTTTTQAEISSEIADIGRDAEQGGFEVPQPLLD